MVGINLKSAHQIIYPIDPQIPSSTTDTNTAENFKSDSLLGGNMRYTWVFSVIYPIEMVSQMFLSQCTDTKAISSLFYKITLQNDFQLFVMSPMRYLYSNTKWNEVSRVSASCPIWACVRCMLFCTVIIDTDLHTKAVQTQTLTYSW